ncbi:MAG: PilZ domain-containing protein [Nitrospirae bacterium]|nr:PilZ domain-containing protein [Nitrospirota bacterium]
MEWLASLVYMYPFRCQLCRHRFKAQQWGVRYSEAWEDKRQYERVAAQFPVSFSVDQIHGVGMATTISVEGCTLETDAKLPKGKIVQLELQTTDRKSLVKVQAAEVRAVRPSCLHLKFLRLVPEEENRLSQLICRLVGLEPTQRP